MLKAFGLFDPDNPARYWVHQHMGELVAIFGQDGERVYSLRFRFDEPLQKFAILRWTGCDKLERVEPRPGL